MKLELGSNNGKRFQSLTKEGVMKTLGRKLLIFCLMAFMAFSFAACQKEEGPAEKAGQQIDQAVDTAEEQVEEAAE